MPTRTAQQRREEAAWLYNAFLETCPTRTVMATIGGKWATLIVTALADGPMRHSELRRRIAGVSQKMLTQSLRELERDGLVSRQVTAEVPVRVDYELTELGLSLVPVVRALKHWSETNIERVLASREEYDSAA